MARDIFSDVLLRMSCSDPFIRKKACLCMISVLTKIPEMVDDMIKSLPTLLSDEDHGVLISGTVSLSPLTHSLLPYHLRSEEEPLLHCQIPQACSSPYQEDEGDHQWRFQERV